MKAHPELLISASQISDLAKTLSQHEVIAFDTEFIRENTFYPVVELLQIATDSESWLVDARADKKALQPLLEIFANPKILKILHAAQGDQECLYSAWKVLATPTLDTAIAASLCGYGEGIGLGNLLKAALGVQIKKGHARTNWSVRPLPDQLIEYAHADVTHLVELGRKLIGELDTLGRREWALEQSAKWEKKELYDVEPEALAERLARGGRVDKKSYGALVELVRWREARVKKLNLPRRWVADDHVLMDLAQVKPKDMAHLGAFRGLNKGELKNSGEEILAAIRRGLEHTELTLPKTQRPLIPTEAEEQVLNLLKCYIGILADRHQVSARHLMTSGQLLGILRAGFNSAQEFVDQEVLSAHAAKLIGDEIVAFLKGKRALSVSGSRVEIVQVQETS